MWNFFVGSTEEMEGGDQLQAGFGLASLIHEPSWRRAGKGLQQGPGTVRRARVSCEALCSTRELRFTLRLLLLLLFVCCDICCLDVNVGLSAGLVLPA